MDDLRKYAVIAEEASPASEDIAEMIRAMQKQLNAVVAPVAPPPPPPPSQPEPRQEPFRGQRGFPSRRGHQRGGRFNNNNATREQPTATAEQRPWSRGQRGRSTGNDNNHREQQQQQQQTGTERLTGPCLQCGWEHPRGQCPARYSICRKCNRTSHWARMCWSKVQPQGYSQH